MTGEELKRRRLALGLSVMEFAQRCQSLPSSVYRWEAGTVELRGTALVAVKSVLESAEAGAGDESATALAGAVR